MKKTCKILSGSLLVALMAFGLVKGNPVEKTGGLQVRDVLAEDVTKDVAGRIVRKADGEAPAATGKVSEVKAQVSEEVEGKRHIRFVVGIDSYAYYGAHFDITFKNGEEVVKTWADQRVSYVYEAVEAAGETVTAADVFGEGYNYLIAFTVNNVPQANWNNTIEVNATVETAEQEYVGTVVEKSVQGIIDAEEGDFLSKRVEIKSNIKGAFTFIGDTEQVISKDNPNFKEVKIEENLGYKFEYYEYDNQKYYSNIISIDYVNKDINVLVVGTYATNELPIINIDTQNVEILSKEDYVDMTFSIENCEDELKDVVGGIRLRGNSTRKYPKKPYRIKFNKKQSLFGMEKAKSWVLLAEWLDPSALHNYTAFKLASEMDGLSFTPTPYKVNVYLNGRFDGLYTLCEQVQENEGRMNIEIDITEEMTKLKDFNFFVCMDESVTQDQTSILGETYFYIEEYDRYIELKYPEKENFVSEEQFYKFFAELEDYMKYIFDMFSSKNKDAINEEINLNSLTDYFIIDQIMGDRDHSYKSFNMYYTNTSENLEENNKLNFGPIWDYDWSLFVPWTGTPNEDYTIKNTTTYYSNVFFKAIAGIPEFYQNAKDRYNNKMSKVLGDYIVSLDELTSSMEESVMLNQQRWYEGYSATISIDNIEFLKAYLINRKSLYDDLWGE